MKATTDPPDERRRRMRAMRAQVFAHDVHAWAKGFIDELEAVRGARG
jgi:trehalose 6-phosphate synthase